MILIDYSGVAVSALFGQISNGQPLSEGLVRHMILNTLRLYNAKYREDYGQMILCCDGGNIWRKKFFPEYKANRKASREQSSIDWNEFFRILNLVRDEIREHVPFRVVHVQGAEADDVIAVLTESTQEFGHGENVMIVSSDQDFLQLQQYSNVHQYSPTTKKMLVEKDAIRFLREKILRGDTGDGVPNVLSDNRVFITDGARQKPLTAKKVEQMIADWDNTVRDNNVARNQLMIDFAFIPNDVRSLILTEHRNAKLAPNSGVFSYLVSKRCSQLIQSTSDFFSEADK